MNGLNRYTIELLPYRYTNGDWRRGHERKTGRRRQNSIKTTQEENLPIKAPLNRKRSFYEALIDVRWRRIVFDPHQ